MRYLSAIKDSKGDKRQANYVFTVFGAMPIGSKAPPKARVIRMPMSMLSEISTELLDETSSPDSGIRRSERVQAAVALGVVPCVAGT